MPNASINSERTSTASAGVVRKDADGAKFIKVYAHTDLTVGTPYVVAYDGDEASNPKTAAAATNTNAEQMIGIATESADSGDITELQIRGDCDIALVDGTTDVAKDDYLEVIDAGTGLIKEGTSRAAGSVAIAREAQATDSNTATSVFLFGDEGAQIAAS